MRTLLAAALIALAAAAPAQAAPRFEPLPGTYVQPIFLTAPPRDTSRVFVVERQGLVKVVEDGIPAADPFIDLTGVVTTDSERGLLGLAFPPDYEASGLVYTYLTGPNGELQIRQHRRSTADPNRTEPDSQVIWRHPHSSAGNHNGGTIEFGPDGMLWLAPGDGGGGNDPENDAQNLGSQLGKLLRIQPLLGGYAIPADNPFAAAGDGAADEVWASGLRNPFRFSFDRGTGDLASGDVGQGAREEIDYARFADALGGAGDFGWRCYEGSIHTPGVDFCEPRGPYIPPVFDYGRDQGRTVTGGVVVRDPGLPTLLGRYLYADYNDDAPEITSLALGVPGADPRPSGLSGPNATHVTAFGEDACGNVYVVSIDGLVNRLADTADSSCVMKPEPRPLPAIPPRSAAPPPPPPGAAADTRRPSLRVRVSGRRRLPRRARLLVALRSDEDVTARLTGRLRGVARFRTARVRLAAGDRRVVRLRLRRAAARKLRRAVSRKRVVARLSVTVTDAAGNRRRAGRRVVVPRRR
jgi:hypothetical protein